MKKMFISLVAVTLMLGALLRAADAEPFHETPSEHDARMQWFRDAKFGMFIHPNARS